MAAKRDYYEVLQVSKTASDGEISTSYRKLAVRYHPDKNPGDEEAVAKFKEAAEAYEVLSDKEKRARYDRFGHAGVDGPGGGSPHFGDVNDIFEAFGDIFGDLFGGGGRGRSRRPQAGGDVRADVTLDLREAAKGCTKEIQFSRHARCKECGGNGAKKGSKPETCRYCGGKGQVVQSTGIFRLQTTCPACHGAGSMISDPCPACRGEGATLERVTREVQIPAGVDTGTRLRITGEGDPSPSGGPPGDCYCFITVKEHSLFERDGQHLICRFPISYAQAALGTTLDVPTLDGRKELEIPAGTQHAQVFKIRGEGMPDPRVRGRGDLLVQVNIEVPTKLSKKQEQLLRELADEEKANVSSHRKTFFDKVKDYFTGDEPSAS